MALSDCVKCWDTPCTCGWEQRGWLIENLEKRIKFLQKVLAFTKANPDAKYSKWDEPETEDDKRFMENLRKEEKI